MAQFTHSLCEEVIRTDGKCGLTRNEMVQMARLALRTLDPDGPIAAEQREVIAKLSARPEALRSGWIPVAERLPTLESDKYLVWFQDQHAVLEYDSQCGWCWGSGDKMLDRSQKEITHWMPLPEAPK